MSFPQVQESQLHFPLEFIADILYNRFRYFVDYFDKGDLIMRFVKTNEIKIGHRIAKPIYNNDGVLLYGRGTTVNDTVMNHINSLDAYGFYVLDAAEPLPHMTDDELEFERFQTVSCHTLQCELTNIVNGDDSQNLKNLADTIVNLYGNLTSKITFIQSIRGPKDNVYKHCLNVAMLCAMISNKLGIDKKEQNYLVQSAFYHDIGKLIAPQDIINKPDKLTPEELSVIRDSELKGFELIRNNYKLSSGIKRYISQLRIELMNKIPGCVKQQQNLLFGTKIIQTADMYDLLTAMRVYKEPTSEFAAVTFLLDKYDQFEEKIVNALIDSINILPPGCCVELTNGEKGLVLSESPYYPLRPTILGFKTNTVYDLSHRKTYETVKIKNIMKTMDNRFEMSRPEN